MKQTQSIIDILGSFKLNTSLRIPFIALLATLIMGSVYQTDAQEAKKPAATTASEFPPFEKVVEGYTEVKPADGKKPLLRIWKRDKDGQMLAELPKDYASPTHRQFIATTVSGGEQFAGLQSDDFYVYWRNYGKRVALIAENLSIRGSDEESKSSVKRLFTDRVLIDLPILTMAPRGGPVIDLDALLVGNANVFFGGSYRGRSNLIKIKKAKAFEKNTEVAFEVPMSNGELKSLHYSISKIEGSPGYKPRKADQRIGYFTTSYSDYGKYETDDTKVRFIDRWHLEKREPKLKLSPPKQPIVFYLEHTTPVRYRRWVRQGVQYWNKAFEQVGIVGAIEVRQQDKATGNHMEKDPEDVQYNFIRWLNNNVSTAIGPSRVNPTTGEILDADIVLTDGWIRVFEGQFDDLMPKVAMQGVTAETLAWYAEHPNWDPRIRMAPPGQREFIRMALLRESQQPFAGHGEASVKTRLMGDEPMDGLLDRVSQVNGSCLAAEGRKMDVAMMRMMMTMNRLSQDKDGEKKPEDAEDAEDAEQLLDGMPESFIGPLLADLVCHEVGHTLGLRHNFKASSIYSLAEINGEEVAGKKPLAGSVMDYLPTNFNFEAGEKQGDYAMIGVGPYDLWAIEYGYVLDDKKLPEILSRVSEPELTYATDQDTSGPDPLARRYDFSKNPLDFANNQMRLAKHHRGHILEKFVTNGDAWDKARKGYLLTLRLQTQGTSMMANWIGGSFVRQDKKGDPNGRKPIEVVAADDQRKALNFVLDNTMYDEAFGLTPELLVHMTSSGWRDDFSGEEPAWPVHDRIMSIQASALSSLMNPSTLRRVYDNEFRVAPDQDALTLNEIVNTVTDCVWKELAEQPEGEFSERQPAISSLRRNLQTEHLERLFDLAGETKSSTAAMKPIANLASMKLKDLHGKIKAAADNEKLDAYTRAHLLDSEERIQKWIDSTYVMNNNNGSSGVMRGFFFGKERQPAGQ